ncbi:hypothetical protein [Chryseobacterium lathyri]|uniref:hypothetical protein n=1 Tax=Chryseobacterium lathyri TaxID=395933 RepID=UPI001CBC700F|nr:hypothetical protein [Chryseobacterium lathyri]
MANKTIFEIRDNFIKFKELFEYRKTIIKDQIILVEKETKKDWTIGDSQTEIELEFDDLEFIVEKKKLDKKYGIKFRSQKFCKTPFFRFDSDGPAHRNYDENIPLNDQKVTTPHFNTFNAEGISIAYKNDVLNNEETAKIIVDDINFGVSLFCQETNSKSNSKDFPEVILKETTLNYDYEGMINFDDLNFE